MPARLAAAYADPLGEIARALEAGRRPIRTLGFDTPRARLIAAGFQPVRLVAPYLDAAPRADAVLGQAEMGPRGRRLLEALIDPVHPQVPVLITQADIEQPQIFAALRELGRLGEPVPEHVHFLDLLHLNRDASRRYNAARLAQLDDWLVSLGGARPDAAGSPLPMRCCPVRRTCLQSWTCAAVRASLRAARCWKPSAHRRCWLHKRPLPRWKHNWPCLPKP
ncbi:hypothetical protein [Novosphingobium sp.]|uniref:hypothetical protein n=1 Tax=Novosphingobium sp. TaxID=1874826 RepID=UPI001ED07677|nr:hypothetical protein [Novosphingobium sp.]MBK9009699.1 hypothetical protein [Novosphingobium sp.]